MGFRANFANMGNAYRYLGDSEKALESYDLALSASKNYYYAHMKKGQILKELGRTDEARESLERALALVRRNNDQLNIRRIEAQLRNLEP
jgi:tetratricopeptide (TPR) repeat protein